MPIDWLTLGAAALTGLMGGVHCAAMCGGIATGFSAMAPRGGWIAALEPNLGRVLGYTLAGVIVGAFGHGILDLARIDWLRTGLRAAVGLVLIVVALRLLDRRGRLAFLSLPGAGLWQKMRPLQRYLLPADSRGKRIALGMLWGWMPCGLSTTLLAAAWLQADAVNGGLTMAVFGLATLPVMLPLTWSGVRLGRWLQRPAWRGAAAGMILLAGLLTLTAPWLVHVPGAHALLSALGCASLPS